MSHPARAEGLVNMIYIYIYTCVLGETVTAARNGHGDPSSNLNKADYISHSTNTLGKGMNPIILPPAMGKIIGQTRFFSLGEATSLREGKL